MEKEFSLHEAILGGIALGRLLAGPKVQGDVFENTVKLVASLDKCGLPVSRAAACFLEEVAAKCPNPTVGIGSEITYSAVHSAKTIYAALSHEAGSTLVVKLQRLLVSEQLVNLDTELSLTESQKVLRDESIRCIECGAYRSGIVMGWNLIYDYIRTWLAHDPSRLAKFDGELGKIINRKANGRQYPPITKYEEFLRKKKTPSERVTLDTLKKSQLVSEDVGNQLIEMLNKRNMYAHASRREATISLANHFVEELITIAKDHFV